MAIQFSPTNSYPINNEDGFPIGQEIVLVFNKSIDLKAFKEAFVLYGSDFDRTSGPDNALWINQSSGTNPFFLKSPAFKGFVDCDFKFSLVDAAKTLVVLSDQYELEKATTDRPTVVIVTPKNILKEDNKYNFFLSGQSVDSLEDLPPKLLAIAENKSVSERTVYDPFKLINSTETYDERIKTYGTFIPKNNESSATLNIKIVTAGEGSQAEYIWWFSDESEPNVNQARYNLRKSRCVQRWRATERGVLLRFGGNQYSLNEEFQVRCYTPVYLENSYTIGFQTGTDAIFEYPENISTSPIGLGNEIIPAINSVSNNIESLKIVSITPSNGSVNEPLDLDKIVIEFNKTLDATTITQDTIKIESFSVSGSFDGPSGTRSNREYKIYKIISVSDKTITLEL